MKKHQPHRIAAITGLALGALLLSSCAGSAPAAPPEEQAAGDSTGDFNLQELVTAAQAEGPITVYDSTSKIETMAEEFTEKYGIEATGVKVDAAEAIEKVTREAQAGNVVGDVVAISDLPALKNQLLPNSFVYSWVPGDLAESIPESMSDPLVMITDPSFFAYNTEVHDTCPASNIWDLTTEEFTGKLAFQDPVGDNGYLDWFSQLEGFGEEELRTAYRQAFGEELETDQDSAAAEWVARLAANNPILTKSSEEASEAVGATGQEDPPMGLISSAKFRNIDEKGYTLGVCEGLSPWVGKTAPKGITIATGTDSPNAAKLFVHYALTAEGIAPQINDGKISSNTDITQPADPANVGAHLDALFQFDNAGLDTDWANREKWQDLWRTASN
ncbi:ABC transporter substrate-binding protein [Glutamicibacter sp. MNS18]|uniref:ABC transporter substrate-binding protein n=1 Tax=Glutamicibacter sp. MNS18 TaxID=2989817 RepID=UPI00223612E6|nr:ABC transporter substrate-binding protein [Glutamicibacter sp. MNS18]MCW4466550.1 ABC transporter substrate-binding protein [Glutamicibacter sp. MNS18]